MEEGAWERRHFTLYRHVNAGTLSRSCGFISTWPQACSLKILCLKLNWLQLMPILKWLARFSTQSSGIVLLSLDFCLASQLLRSCQGRKFLPKAFCGNCWTVLRVCATVFMGFAGNHCWCDPPFLWTCVSVARPSARAALLVGAMGQKN